MNLHLAHKLISAAEAQPHGFLKVRGRREAREVKLMADAGLVKASTSDNIDPSEAVIVEVTEAGHKLLRALKVLPDFSNG